MIDWDKINCNKCTGHCNKKGYPSASKGSAYCQEQKGQMTEERSNKWKSVKNFFRRV